MVLVKKKEEDIKCFICKKTITRLEMDNEEIEMITGPENKKVFVHKSHEGVNKKVREEIAE